MLALRADGIMLCRCPELDFWATSLCHSLFSHFCFMSRVSVQQQQYVDNTQLYIALSPSDPRNELNALHTCRTSLQIPVLMAWRKTPKSLVLFYWVRASSYSSLTSVDVAGTPVQLVNAIKLTGVTLYIPILQRGSIPGVSQSCFYHIRAFRHVLS